MLPPHKYHRVTCRRNSLNKLPLALPSVLTKSRFGDSSNARSDLTQPAATAITQSEASRLPSADNVMTDTEEEAVWKMQKKLTSAVEAMQFHDLLNSGSVV